MLAVPIIPANTYIATIGSHPNVNGKISVIAMTLPKPGITPNVTPSAVPSAIAPMTAGSAIWPSAAAMS